MAFNDFLNKSWNDHAEQPAAVAERFPEGISLLEKNEQIPAFANLVTHVMGEHLGQWHKGIALLKQIRSSKIYVQGSEAETAIVRSIAGLEVAGGLRRTLDEFSISDQIRILAVAASALSEKNPDEAQRLFRQAIEKASEGISKEDPANRALAVTGNNLACALEEKPARSSAETELMILAAKTGRQYWEVAGGWLETERAEYRLSQTYLKSGNTGLALDHALKCVEICRVNHAAPLEFFFAYEALALTEKARGNSGGCNAAVAEAEKNFLMLSDDDRSWCEASLKKLKD